MDVFQTWCIELEISETKKWLTGGPRILAPTFLIYPFHYIEISSSCFTLLVCWFPYQANGEIDAVVGVVVRKVGVRTAN